MSQNRHHLAEDSNAETLKQNVALQRLKKLSQKERLEAAKKSLEDARLLMENPALLRDLYDTSAAMIKIASFHEVIALEMFDDSKYYDVLNEMHEGFYENPRRRIAGTRLQKNAMYLAEQFPQVRKKLVDASLSNDSHPKCFRLAIYELLDSGSELPFDEKQQHKIDCYEKLSHKSFKKLSDDDILKLLDAVSSNPADIKKRISDHERLAEIAFHNEKYFNLIDREFGWNKVAIKHENIALLFLKEKPQLNSVNKYKTSIKWLSVCEYVLSNPELANILTGKELFSLQKEHGVAVQQLISAADLQGKVYEYVLEQLAKTSSDVKKSNDKSEQLLQCGLFIKSSLEEITYRRYRGNPIYKIDLIIEYFYEAARLGNEEAHKELKQLARKTRKYSLYLRSIEARYIANGSQFTDPSIIETIKKDLIKGQDTIGGGITGDLSDFLISIKERISASENKEHLAIVRKMYIVIIKTLTEDATFNRDYRYYKDYTDEIYRVLADLCQENELEAFDYLAKIPADLRKKTDVKNMAKLVLPAVERFKSLTTSPTIFHSIALPFYLRAGEYDEDYKSKAMVFMQELGSDSSLSENGKGKRLLESGWMTIPESNATKANKLFIKQAKLAWEKASEFKNPIAIYILKNYDLMQKEDDFLFNSLRLISEKNLANALPLLDSIMKLASTSKVRNQFTDFLSAETITDEMLKRQTRIINRIAESEKRHAAVNKAIDEKLVNLANVLKSDASRRHEDSKEAIRCKIRAGVLNRLAERLREHTNEYFSQDFSVDRTPIEQDVYERIMHTTIHNTLTHVNDELKEHMSFFTWIAYNLVRALRTTFPSVTTFRDWKYSFHNDLTAVPVETDRDNIENDICGAVMTKG